MMRNIISFIQNLTARFRPSATQPPTGASSASAAPSGGGLGQPPQGPRQRKVNVYQVQPLINGSVVTRLEETGRDNSTLSVDVIEIRVPTANGTVVDAKEIALICGECGLPSEEEWYCDFCSMPLCVPHLLCVRLPGSGDILHLCENCCKSFYQKWNTWDGQLSAPFSVRKETRQKGQS